MDEEFNTSIVTKSSYNKMYVGVLCLCYIIAVVLLFVYDTKNSYIKIGSSISILIGTYFQIKQSLLPPKKIGSFHLTKNRVRFTIDEKEETMPVTEIISLYLNYSGYGGWCNTTLHGNKNFLKIRSKTNTVFQFEILLKNVHHKDVLKKLLQSEGLINKYDVGQTSSSRAPF